MTDPQQPETPQAQSPETPEGFDLGTVIEQAKQVITDPANFYRAMPAAGGYREPMIFGLVMAALAGAVFAVLSIIGLTGAGFAGVAAILLAPIGTLLGSFIAAAALFVVWKLMGSPKDYQTAYRCVAYSYAILPVLALLSIIPYLGTFVRVAWSTWLMVTASVTVHGRKRQSTLIVFGILGLIVLSAGLSAEHTQRNMQSSAAKHAAQLEAP